MPRPPDAGPPPHLLGVALPPTADISQLRARYGVDRRRSGVIVVAALVVVPFLGWVVWAGLQQADQEVRWETVSFDSGPEGSAPSSVQINFDVFFPAGTSLECTVRALDADGVEVGRADVPVNAEGTSATVDYALQVTARPSSAFVQTCRLTD